MTINLLDDDLAIGDKIRAESEFGITFEYPNRQLSTYPNGLWGRMTNLRGPGEPTTLGPNGQDTHVGVIQIDINQPVNDSLANLLNKASEVANAFKAGQRLTKNNVSLRLFSLSVSPDRIVGGWRRISISASYDKRVSRG